MSGPIITGENGITKRIFPDCTVFSVPRGEEPLLNPLIKGKNFILWEFNVSHCQLTLRHNEQGTFDCTDLYFSETEYISLPTNMVGMGEIQFTKTSAKDVKNVQKLLRTEIDPAHVMTITADGRKYYIAADSLRLINRTERKDTDNG